MKKLLSLSFILLIAGISYGFTWKSNDSTSFKCLIQLTNYGGEGAYVIVSLINPEGEYEKTLSVHGDDEEWYEDLPEWYEFYEGTQEPIDGISGASILSGGRKIAVLGVETSKINAGYKLRFETAVEDQEYYAKDLEVELNEENVRQRLQGEGYIRYIQLIKK